tara:strand:+ start:6156 stop:6410 length:255 start_codon:yes stop_codon:yes gene_type:complete
MGKDKAIENSEALETVAEKLHDFIVEFEAKQIVRSEVTIKAKTRTDAEKQFKSTSDSLDLKEVLATGRSFNPQLVGKSVRAFPA